jgi:Zn-dependent protease
VLFARNDPAALVGILVALLVGLTFHEFSHAFVADQLGDHRPRALGRVSLNPVRHIDPMGALMLVIVGFGWAKPVPINPAALRPGRRGLSMVAAAGPVANVSVAVLAAILFRAVDAAGAPDFLLSALGYTVLFNFVLAIFNLVPIPPLDGYNVVLPFLPPQLAWQVQRYAPYGMTILLVIILASYLLPGPGPLGWIFDASWSLTRLVLGA